jgi:cytochrome b561
MSMRYDRTAVFLHWTIGLAILGQFALGVLMQEVPKGSDGARAAWFNVHKSIGITLGALVVLRLLWRASHAPPPLPARLPAWQSVGAKASHYGLYACMLVMPLSGYLGSTFSGYPIKYFGYTLPHWAWAWPAAKQFLAALHSSTAWCFVVLVTLHVGAALWHLVRADGVFRRMWI